MTTAEITTADMQAAVAYRYFDDKSRAAADCTFAADYAATIYAAGERRWDLDVARGLDRDEDAIDRRIERQEAAAERYAAAMILRIALVHGWDTGSIPDTGN